MNQFYLNLIRHRLAMRACRSQRLVLDKASAKRVQQGFSLLELVVVVALLSIVALASTSLLIDNGDLKRQEATETRWDQLHDAIISQPNLYLNGSPYVRGYVADMGRLPVSIFELMNQSELVITYDEDNDGGAATPEITTDQPDFQGLNLGYTACSASPPPCTPGAVYTDEIQGGWRGPYLYTAGHDEFRDGWGREDVDLDQDAFNFGWNIITGQDDTDRQAITEVTNLIIQSFGSDQDQFGTGDFTEDFPLDAGQTIVSEPEWMLSASPITFNINFSNAIRAVAVGLNPVTLPPTAAGAAQELELRVYRYVDDGDNAVDATDLLTVSADATFTVIDGSSAASATITPEEADFAAATPVRGMPIGRYAALIWCTNNNNLPLATADFTDDTVYDGDCNLNNPLTPVDHSPVYFTLTNNTSQVTLTWDLP